jgi:flagellar motor component MotA
MKKVALICLVVMGCTVVMGATLKAANPFGNMDQVEKIVKAVAAFYKGCENEKASVVMAELAIVDLCKKHDRDAVPYLERALEEVEEPGLRNFTKFLIANCHKENGDIDKALDRVFSVISEEKIEEKEVEERD